MALRKRGATGALVEEGESLSVVCMLMSKKGGSVAGAESP